MQNSKEISNDSKQKSLWKLPNRKVILKPIIRDNPIIRDSGIGDVSKHVGYFMWDNTSRSYVLPLSSKTGTFVRILNEEQETVIGKLIDRNLSIYNKTDNFWKTFKVIIHKEDVITVDGQQIGKVFDLSDPYEYLAVQVLKASGEVRPSPDAPDRREYMFVLSDLDYQDKKETDKAEIKMKVYKEFLAISGSRDAMYNTLAAYWLSNDKYSKPASDVSIDFLKAEIEKLIEKDLSGMYKMFTDPDIDYKYSIHKALEIGAISRNRTNKMFELPDNTILGSNIDQVITFLKQPIHNEEWLRIQAVIENAKGK